MYKTSAMRTKSSMILFELEQGLGRLCTERIGLMSNSPVAAGIVNRYQKDGSGKTLPLSRVVESSYLSEVLSLAMDVFRETSTINWLRDLRALMDALAIFDIRNAVCHPNRPFPEHYWYKCAAVATDPCIDALGLGEVVSAFNNAMEGKIQDPPDEWLCKIRWSVPALFPTQFEHSVTGLVGRRKDVVRLEKELENTRIPLIALVARGGVGKTSLALQVLSDFCLSSKSIKLFDAAIWATLKQEKLTANGIEILSAPKSIGDLKCFLASSIQELLGIECQDWDQAMRIAENRRVLLCVDNLELIIRDSSEDFQQFHESLPLQWKLLVTSRIPVDGAKNIPLDVLDKAGAVDMVRAYLSSKGYEHQRDMPLLERIAIGCKFNPLAIRLTVDLFLAGKDIDSALQLGDQSVLVFSFTSLLETLSDLENDLLEAFFVLEKSSRFELCGALKQSIDDVAHAISRLLSMSFIVRSDEDGEERYSLAPSIKDLLRAHPRKLAMRTAVAVSVAKLRASEDSARKFQAEKNISPVALEFIPHEIGANYISLSKQINAAAKHGNRAALVDLLKLCQNRLEEDPEASFLHRLSGVVLLGLDDSTGAINSFLRARNLSIDDPAPLYGLIMAYTELKQWGDIYCVGCSLIDAGWGDPVKSGSFYANRIWNTTLRSANFGEKVDEVFDKTSDWENRLQDLPALAVSRASAYRKLIEIESRKNRLKDDELCEIFGKAVTIISKVVVTNNFVRWIIPELGRFISDIERYESRGINLMSSVRPSSESVVNFLKLCIENDSRLVSDGVAPNLIDFSREKVGVLSSTEAVRSVVDRRNDYFNRGFILTKIKNGIRSNAKYFFVQDADLVDYYVGMDVFENGFFVSRDRLFPGVEVAIKVGVQNNGNSQKALEAWFIG